MPAAVSRRALFARFRGGPPQARPPWARAEASFTARCTLCHACLAACPTGVLAKGHAGYPIVVFAEARCTFCGACAQACDAGCFDRAGGRPPWPLKAGITRACVERKGVSCRMCQEVCEAGAIRFRPQLGGGSSPSIDVAACTGCGACVAPCPVEAVTITAPEAMEACA